MRVQASQAEQQNQQTRRVVIPPEQGNADGRGVQHVHIDLAARQGGQAFFDERRRRHRDGHNPQGQGQERSDEDITEQRPPGERLSGCLPGLPHGRNGRRQRRKKQRARGIARRNARIQQQHASGDRIDADALNAFHSVQGVRKLMRRGNIECDGGTEPYPAGNLMYNGK